MTCGCSTSKWMVVLPVPDTEFASVAVHEMSCVPSSEIEKSAVLVVPAPESWVSASALPSSVQLKELILAWVGSPASVALTVPLTGALVNQPSPFGEEVVCTDTRGVSYEISTDAGAVVFDTFDRPGPAPKLEPPPPPPPKQPPPPPPPP